MASESMTRLEELIATDPQVRREVQQIQAGLQRLRDEREARTIPPHMDGPYRDGIFQGLVLALHMVTNGMDCDQDECAAHERILLTEIPLVEG